MEWGSLRLCATRFTIIAPDLTSWSAILTIFPFYTNIVEIFDLPYNQPASTLLYTATFE